MPHQRVIEPTVTDHSDPGTIHCRVMQVLGESMEPTPVDGCSILVNHAIRRRYVGRLHVVRTEDGLIVKRADRDPPGPCPPDIPNTVPATHCCGHSPCPSLRRDL